MKEVTSTKISYKEKVYKTYQEPKIVQLLMIFYDIMKSLKASMASEEKQLSIISKFKEILLCEDIKQFCEIGCDIIYENPSSPQMIPVIHEFIDCFFAVFNILQEKDQREKEKYEIKIADLGEVK